VPPLPDAERLRALRRGKLPKLVRELSVALVPFHLRSARDARWFARGVEAFVREPELCSFVRQMRHGAADAFSLKTHPELVALPSEACAAADMPPIWRQAHTRAAFSKVKPRRYVAGPWVMKHLARWVHRRGQGTPERWRVLSDAPLGHPGNR
jgi:hypothetical protein